MNDKAVSGQLRQYKVMRTQFKHVAIAKDPIMVSRITLHPIPYFASVPK
jgi:hypothetical protein